MAALKRQRDPGPARAPGYTDEDGNRLVCSRSAETIR